MNKIRTKKEKMCCIFAFFLILCIYFLRIGFLEQDLAPWGVGYYQPGDEGQYALPAINEYNLGEANPEHLESYSSFTPYNLRTNLFGNILVLWGLETFGDNYFGFRISSVIFGFLNLLLLYVNLNWLKRMSGAKNSRMANWTIVGIIGFLVIDFTFFNASIVVEPTIVRMLVAQILLFIVLLTKNNGYLRYFLLAFFSMLGIGVVYFTNLFFLLACGLLLLLQWRKEGTKKFIQYGIMFVLGMLVAGVLAEIYYMKIFGSHFWNNFINAILSFSNSTGYEITGFSNIISIPKAIIKSVAFYFSANPFFYCIPILCIILIFLPGILVSIFKKMDETVAFLFALPFSFLLQTLFSIDCITRKAIVIYPATICLIYYFYLNYKTEYLELINSKIRKKFQSIYLGIASIFIMCVVAFRLFIVSDGTRLDFTSFEKILIVLVGTVTCLVLLLWHAADLWLGTNTIQKFKKICIVLSLLPLCVSPVMVMKHFVLDRTYTERDMQIEFGKVANDKYVVGAYVSGFTLYNDIKPVTVLLEEVAYYMQDDPNLLYLDYEDKSPGMRSYYDDIVFAGKDISAYPVYCGSRNFQTFGVKRGFTLFETKPKFEIVQIWKEENNKYLAQLKEVRRIDEEVFSTLSTEERIQYIAELKDMEQKYIAESNIYNPYPDITSTIYSSLQTEDIYVNIYADIYGDMHYDVYGNIYGDIRGDVYGTIYGNVYGTVYGNVYGEIEGTVLNGIKGTVR